MKLDRHTQRLYDAAPFQASADTRIMKVGPDYLELEATVAFPEGGGQEADTGVIRLEDGTELRFHHAQKMYGHRSGVADVPDILVGGVIWHMVGPDQASLLERAKSGMAARVSIDVERRARLSLSHTASHLLYLAVARHRPDAIEATLGCHISLDGARFDFGVEARFSPEELAQIEQTANAYVARDAAITFSSHPEVSDARYWHCEGQTIACGGTHLDRTGAVGPMTIRRRRLGAGKERLSCTFESAVPPVHRFEGGTP